MATPPAVVEIEGETIRCRRPNGFEETIRFDQIEAVLLETTAAGPFASDLFWILAGKARGCVVPNDAEGTAALLRRLQEFPDFDNGVVIEAMGCAEPKRFLCWRRPK